MLNYFERRLGRFAVPNLTVVLIIGQVLIYVAVQQDPGLWERLALIPRKVTDGELLRLVAFLFSPPDGAPIWAFFYWYLFYIMGTSLEHYWGTFRYNVYLLIGFVATIAVSFLTPESATTNQFVQGTVFLAFARLNPNFELRIFFILPVRIVWLAMMTWIFYSATVIWGTWPARLQVLASVLNFMLFFGPDVFLNIKHGHRRMTSQARKLAVKEPDYFHQCVSCGITDKSHPQMDFRYCSQCSGGRAYCEEHLRNHEHVVSDDDES